MPRYVREDYTNSRETKQVFRGQLSWFCKSFVFWKRSVRIHSLSLESLHNSARASSPLPTGED